MGSSRNTSLQNPLTIIDTAKQRPPSDTARYCNLQKNPNDNKQYEVKI